MSGADRYSDHKEEKQVLRQTRIGRLTTIVTLLTLLMVMAAVPAMAAGDGSLDRVTETGQLVVGIEGAFPPLNMFDERGELIGFDVDISKEVARRLGVDIKFVPTAWEGIVVGLLIGGYDAVISSLAITPERSERVAFTQTYYRSGAAIVVPSDSDLTGPSDLPGRRVGATLGTTYLDELEDMGATVMAYEDDLQSFQDLSLGRLDALVTDRLVALMILDERDYNMEILDELIYTEDIGIAVRPQDDTLRVAINDALTDMYADGTYEAISTEWFGADIR